MSEKVWGFKQQTQVARLAGVPVTEFNDIIHRRRQTTSVEKAKALEAASAKILGEENKIGFLEFMQSRTTENKYFI